MPLRYATRSHMGARPRIAFAKGELQLLSAESTTVALSGVSLTAQRSERSSHHSRTLTHGWIPQVSTFSRIGIDSRPSQ